MTCAKFSNGRARLQGLFMAKCITYNALMLKQAAILRTMSRCLGCPLTSALKAPTFKGKYVKLLLSVHFA